MTDSDFQAFQRIQKAYFQRVCTDENSLLARIYGIYSVVMEDKKPVKLVVMGNTMKNASRHLAVFDLKGSTIKRIVKGKITNTKTTLKDMNLLNMNTKNLWLNFDKKDRKKIMNAMMKDAEMLRQFNLMDYSLLLCI
jgi:1-phosphatidylinositol-4-phosphate 5-kinase